MTDYVTSEGDMLDAVCWGYYGRSAGVTEVVLEYNPGLAEYGAVYPAGIVIRLPAIAEPSDQTTIPVRLWD